MRFVKPIRFEIFLFQSRGDEIKNEVLVCSIDEKYQVTWHAPIELFITSRNMAVIHGVGQDGRVVRKDFMQVGTKKQEYAKWEPVLTAGDFEKMVQKLIATELGKAAAYESDSRQFDFYKEYVK